MSLRTVVAMLIGCLVAIAPAFAVAEDSAHPPESTRETIILLHGLGRGSLAMAMLQVRLHVAGYETHALSYESLRSTPEEILGEIEAQIDACCAVRSKPAAVHFVGHSLGGLIVRAYLARHRPPRLGRVVLLGTPNQGSRVADYVSRWRLTDRLPAVRALGTGNGSLPASLPAPDYEVGVIAGDRGRSSALSDLLGDENDGMVAVENTRLVGMADFLVMPVSHVGMRYDRAVADQVVHFLRHGGFDSQRARSGATIAEERDAGSHTSGERRSDQR